MTLVISLLVPYQQSEDITQADYLIAGGENMPFKRTIKSMTAISRGIPVLDIKWLRDSAKAKQQLPVDGYILRDKAKEKEYKFRYVD